LFCVLIAILVSVGIGVEMASAVTIENHTMCKDMDILSTSKNCAFLSVEKQFTETFTISAPTLGSKQLALEHLKEVMDKYHSNFNVYTDLSAAGNHFVMLAQMGSDVEINPGCYENPYRGATCIENKFSGTGTSWGGWYLMNGVLEGEEIQPKANWGEYPDAGLNLTGATKLTFWARGKEGGERVEFFAFGVGRNADTSEPIAPYPDSSPKRSLGYITLSKEWQHYTIDLSGVDLSYVLGGFGWVTNAPQNDNQPIIFYLDDIKYDKDLLDDPRFLVSYELLPTDEPVLKNIAYTYDNDLALLTFLANGTKDDLRRARLIGDALVYAINNDRYFADGRLRNAYQGGDLKLFPGWTPHGKSDTVRMPGWWDMKNNTWYEDKYCASTHTGNVAWSIIALLSLYDETHEDKYLNASIRLGEWIETEGIDERGAGGYTGGYEGWERTANNPQGQKKNLWKSTEHNIDVYVAFSRVYNLTGDEMWRERASHAKHFVKAMWDETEEHFWTGTLEDGITINKAAIPADVNAWGLMALDELNKYKKGIEWVGNNCYVEADGFKGFDFNNDKDGVWFEGTAHMIVAYKILGEETKANLYLNELERAQKEAQNTNEKGLVAASHDEVTTGFDWLYNARLHIGATAWFIFGELGYNPYWNIKTSEPIPSSQSPEVWSDGYVELTLNKMERTDTVPPEFTRSIFKRARPPKVGHDFVVINLTLTRIEGRHVLTGSSPILFDDKGNSYTCGYMVQEVIIRTGKGEPVKQVYEVKYTEAIEGSKWLLISEMPKDREPVRLRFIYSFTESWEKISVKEGQIEMTFP
jgi:hypothetical protein